MTNSYRAHTSTSRASIHAPIHVHSCSWNMSESLFSLAQLVNRTFTRILHKSTFNHVTLLYGPITCPFDVLGSNLKMDPYYFRHISGQRSGQAS